jgi:hypothetical protein
MSVGEIIFLGIIGLILGLILLYIITVLIHRRRNWKRLHSLAGPEFQPSKFYVLLGVGIAIDVVRRRFAVATSLTNVQLEATDIIDIRIRDSSVQGMPSLIVEIDLRSAVIPTLRFQTYFSGKPRLIASLLKVLQTDAAREDATGEKSPPKQEVPVQVLTMPGLEQELAALRREVSKLTAVLTSLGDIAKTRTQHDETHVQSDPLCPASDEEI